jgi:ABC-type multidrug transport system permease subunit
MTKDFQTKILPILLLIVKFSLISIFARSIGPTIITLISLLYSSLIYSFIFYYIVVFYNNNPFKYKKILFIFFVIFMISLQSIFINMINSTVITIILLLNSSLACSLIFYYSFHYDFLKLYNIYLEPNF